MLRANLLNDIVNLSIEQDDSDDFSSDCEDNSEDDLFEWDMKSGLYMFTHVRKLWDRSSFLVLTLSLPPSPPVLKPCTKRVL